VAFPCSYIRVRYILTPVHAPLGGGGLRWQPLNVAVAMSSWRDASYMAGGNGDSGTQLRSDDRGDQITEALVLWLWGLLTAVMAEWWQSPYSTGF
jgi:hypothetical protein